MIQNIAGGYPSSERAIPKSIEINEIVKSFEISQIRQNRQNRQHRQHRQHREFRRNVTISMFIKIHQQNTGFRYGLKFFF